ncbi:secretion/DNA translocation related CpaE-like protein [Arthrobacter sp. CAN_A212]|uniref:septum site-determining protein Ssd n=1 Tax=Arthrobacter sp. CAN_A212 TaxID=2787719 RepID=UPI0018C9FF65
MTTGQPWLPAPDDGGAALVTGSQRIRDETARVAAAAGLELTVTGTLSEARMQQPAVLLVGTDIGATGPTSDSDLILVGLQGEETSAWEVASRIHASQVALLPAAAPWLAGRFAALRTRGPAGHLLGVLGSTGGAGASSLSCWLSLAAARSGRSTLLLDGDPGGGGLDLALGAGRGPRVRWEDLGEVSGTLNPDQLVGALPTVSGVSVLSMSGAGAAESDILASPAAPSVVDAVRTAFTLTVVDLPSGWPAGGPLLQVCDAVVLLVPGRARSIAAARSLAHQTQHLPGSVVARGPLVSGLDPHRVAELTGLPLGGYLPQLRGVHTAEHQGRLLEFGSQRSLRRLTSALLASLPDLAGRARR